ncbi:MAG: transposase [Oscillospiraceae bacterium]|nr:transposase [Oscillospiraceae bacterium]
MKAQLYFLNNINLIFLPPYSPNLNLIERLWKFLHKKIMANKYYCTFSEFYQAVSKFIDELHQFECLASPLSG